MSKMSTSELRSYQQICGNDGAMMVIACDQRGAMRSLLSSDPQQQARISERELGIIKADITRYLASKASCVLVDAVCAVPQLVDDGIIARDTALLIGLDASGWDVSQEGYRLSRLVPKITARRVRELGATGGKIMVYLRADHPAANQHNIAILHHCIEDFAREDLLLVVEFLTYKLESETDEAYKEKVPSLIYEGTKICLDCGAKVLKLPYPGSRHACEEITKLAGDVPWAVLSAGVDHATFLTQVADAMSKGASGVIAGRSLWKDCISLDRTSTRERLETLAIPRLNEIQAVIQQYYHAAK
ncbi:tagatose-bisphosphate aldolase [Prodigiosinella confusarubida]|uniref:Tagatose-bisphosphate aldolase n=1 Tax=Serratia sp. (strain ATCC 39006) TaxID=104623 RepID=A0A2I5TII4_SERS3|nr:deoxyribose-phosphate aldolase/phospho-2-dehydro-3-deoxyheptonate aldolase [Serratia sp. ATCC 39006]AUH00065.1 tagatose-bisphosphate aldolase [Serratia sp. ATCC 39006]AUH04384.1 tagatose-bisphosphate aldolase [Serratia sp. ATCC 39006]